MHQTKRSRSTDTVTIRDFWRASKTYRKHFILGHLTPVSSIGLGVVIPFSIGKILSGLAQNNLDNIWLYVLIGTSLVTILANRIAFLYYLELVPKVMADLQEHSLRALLRRGHSFHNNNISGKLVSDAIDYPNSYSQLAGAWFVDILPFATIILLGIVIVSINSPLMGLVIFLMTALAIISTLRFRSRMAPYRKRRLAAAKTVTAHIGDAIVNAPTIKAYASEDHELAHHKELSHKLVQYRIHDWRAVAFDGSWRIAGLLFFEITFILIVIHQVQNDPALLATGIFAFSYTITLSNRLFQIGNIARQVEESLLNAEPMTQLLHEPTEINDAANATAIKLTSGDVSFENVLFRYHDSATNDTVFTNLNLRIKAGEKVGLVGPSGGGKSTLTKLLLRFENINEGRIAIDNQDISEVTQKSLRDTIAYVAQEPLLFHRSIRENIAYGNPAASEDQIIAAAQKAHAHGFIESLAHGYDTIVGERGIKLSGGQRQRIAIARAILKDAPILVLDEATSALDSESEKAIQSALRELMQNKTAIVIAHRLSTIQKMDRIIVVDAGKIIEAGTHKELLAKKGKYATLWAHQSGGFIEE